ncbi:hypothetical protein [Komagataeibacter oboediens]|uniref:Uncharacterized protein n=1 Tax=Komagataeibacter oboediens TaxID=65958 RepID=A0ABS5SJ14_9PROT|nr:hypothetical protein [Komagataeibacter oboediens]MBL7232888.1 hypothetical protein [Komagataeibacter oboediens]MBT0674211.1 hypothetical protein [Komagataeibacter oboediens]MBT0679372.1 hypothetical protein [Komagataeibacter oboediens]
MSGDGRIALEFMNGPAAIPPRSDTLLVVGDGDMPPQPAAWAAVVTVDQAAISPFAHAAGCACCTGRGGGLAAVLGDVFRRRATGALKWFDRVAVLPPRGHEAAWRAALSADVLVSARFAVRPPRTGAA